MKGLVIVGAGGLGREFLGMIGTFDEWACIAFKDDKLAGTEVEGIQVYPLDHRIDFPHIIVIGNPQAKVNVCKRL